MKTKLLLWTIALIMPLVMNADGRRVTYTFDVTRPIEAVDSTACLVKITLLDQLYGLSSKKSIQQALTLKTLKLAATHTLSSGTESFYTTTTADEGYGHWFTKSGIATAKVASKYVCVTFDGENFYISHNKQKVAEGDEAIVKESFIYSGNTDTLTYVFNIKFGQTESVTTDQKSVVFSRPNYTDSWLVHPRTKKNDNEWSHYNYVQCKVGDSFTLSATIDDTVGVARYMWLDPSGNKLNSYNKVADFTIENAADTMSGMYTLQTRITLKTGSITTKTYHYFVDVQTNPGEFYDWPANTATFSYNFRDEYPTLEEPQKVHNFMKWGRNGQKVPANKYVGRWWSAFWGDNLNKTVGDDSATVYQAAKNMVDYFDQEFEYIRDVMGWPPDYSARCGWKSIIYIYGSGLTEDSEDPNTAGGFQSAVWVDDATWACVWASYYPFSRFRSDADMLWGDGGYQRGALVHEGIHAVLADLPGAKSSAWFQEAGNTWLQGKMAQLRGDGTESDDARAGWLDGAPFLAPFMPIECYSGWLQDGSFGGPAAEGVNRYNEKGQQLCTWRNYLGGTQYGNSFPYVLSSFCGNGSIPWIWRNCTGHVLSGIGRYVGDDAMRKIVLQYRSRMAIYDFGIGCKGYRNVCNDNFGNVIGPEYSPYWMDCPSWAMTPYAKPTLNDDDGWLAPDTLTNPGWSGANFIPIHVDKSKDRVEVDFRPEDTNMRAQLCYRTKEGGAYYSQPVYCGTVSLDISDRPANEVVILVVANTDYIYEGEDQRKHHWDYRIHLGDGAMAVADNYQRWYFYEWDITDSAYEQAITGIKNVTEDKEGNVTSNASERYSGFYDLTGRKVKNPTKGIYIHNGKKIYLK